MRGADATGKVFYEAGCADRCLGAASGIGAVRGDGDLRAARRRAVARAGTRCADGGRGLTGCAACDAELSPGDRFCAQCGAPQNQRCPSCGLENRAANRFCPSCGAALTGVTVSPSAAQGAPVSERRLVSVLFADLVGFTTLSEHRDPEEVRDLLSQYFDRCRSLIERYGGTVEKFIGDAVMAVWGTPVAREDDAERAVRAALALTTAVALLGDEVGMPELRVRAGRADRQRRGRGRRRGRGDGARRHGQHGVAAAVDRRAGNGAGRRRHPARVGGRDRVRGRGRARGQGPRAAGARVDRAAGRRRRRRRAPQRRARGAVRRPRPRAADGRSTSFEASADAAAGAAGRPWSAMPGSGKSRLLWEFFKYIDGMREGRSLASGPLPVVRRGGRLLGAGGDGPRRAGIAEEEDAGVARARSSARRSRSTSTDERERRLVEPRLAHLLGLEERPDAGPRRPVLAAGGCSSSGWPTASPVVLVFEDLQWADSGLLDFIDYLLEWSAEHPIFVLALGRPELRERRPGWDAGDARAARDGIDLRDPRRAGAGTARELVDRDRRPRRGHPAVCGRDDQDAPGPRTAGPGGAALRGDRRRFGSRRPGDAAGARRVSARRPVVR